MDVKANPHCPLAFDADGNPMQLAETARRWRVRRGGGRRGRPRNVFDAETGLQLELPVGASLEDLIERGCPPDRYRLEAVDESGHIIAGVVAVVEVPANDDEVEQAAKDPADNDATVIHLRSVIDRLVAANSSTMQAMASAFGTVRPQHEGPAPVVVQAPTPVPAPAESGFKPEQLMQLFTTFGPMLAQGIKSIVATSARANDADTEFRAAA